MRASGRLQHLWLLGVVACGATAPSPPSSPASEPTASQPNATQPNATQPNATQPNATEPPTPATRPPPAPLAPSFPAAGAAKVGGPALERTHTGQEQPTIVVNNGLSQPQHLFLDGRHLGSVEPGASATFEVPLGVHTFTSADSSDPNDSPSSVTEPFESGYRYQYLIRGR